MRPIGPPIAREADQRYWRRRANRRVRKARLTRTLLRWTAFALAHLLIGGVVLYAGVRTFLHLTSAAEFSVRRIEVLGARRASAEAIRQRLDAQLGRNLLDLNLHEVVARVEDDPWVEWASAKRVLPDLLRVEVGERAPRALALIGGVAHLVDTGGFVIRAAGRGAADDLPVLIGLDGLADAELVRALRRGAGMVGRLEATAPGWTAEISELDLSRRDRIVVRTVDPGPTILLDPDDPGRNLVDYLALRHEIRRRVGQPDYVDLRWRGRIAVMPPHRKPDGGQLNHG